MICTGCHTLNFRDYKYCRECGQKLEPPAPALSAQPTAMPTAANADETQIQHLLDEAFHAFDAENYSDAALACHGALSLRPESTAAHSLLGLIYERQGQLPDAIQQYRIVLDLNPASQADRAMLDALLSQTGQAKRRWLPALGKVRRPVLAGVAAGAVVLLGAVLLMARSSGRTGEASRHPLIPPTARAAVVPAPMAPVPSPVIVPPPMAGAGPATTVDAFPRRVLSNVPIPTHFATTMAPPPALPRVRPPARAQPTYLPPAPIRGVLPSGGSGSGALRPASGSPPTLPDFGAASQPSMALAQPAAGQQEPSSGTGNPEDGTPPVMADGTAPASSISVRVIPDANAAQTAASGRSRNRTRIQSPEPSLLDARQHFDLAAQLRHQGDVEGAYREYARAREMFRIVNSRGGTEGVQAAEGYHASNRAMLEISGGPR